jgi:DNA-binding MarR family transcriptional regulator
MSRDEAPQTADASAERGAESASASESAADLSADEKSILEVLVSCGSARTIAQLCATSGMDREQVTPVVEGLRAKGLVTRFNTLVESYGARFPGLEV